MKKKVISLIFIFMYFAGSFINTACASDNVFQGHAEKADKVKQQNELFTGSIDKLDRKDVLKMTVSQVIDASSTKNGDEFFAEVTTDVEGNKGVIIPSGTLAHGKIKQVASAKRLGRDGALDLDFDYLITPDGREIPIRGKMSTRLHPIAATSKIVATDLVYTAAGSVAGGLFSLALLGLGSAVASQGATIAGGAALGGTTGLGIALYRKGKDVLISPGDEFRVKINTSTPLPVYKKTALLQHELIKEGLDVKINDIIYQKDAYDEVNTIKLSLTISNKTNITFSTFDLALINDYNTLFYPAIFGDTKSEFKEINPGDTITGEIPFCVDRVKDKFWLTFYDKKNKKVVAKISINNAYRKISNKSKKRNEKASKKRNNYYKEDNPFN